MTITRRTKRMRNKGMLLVLSGPSGSGKDTVIAELMKLGLNAELIGGYDSAERRIAVFGSEETTGYPYE